MGLSASQARLLNLTRRMHDIEYKAQNLEAQKLQMANDSKAVYYEYENALNKQKVQFKQIGADGSASYVDATVNTLLGAGYQIKILGGSTWYDLIDNDAPGTSTNWINFDTQAAQYAVTALGQDYHVGDVAELDGAKYKFVEAANSGATQIRAYKAGTADTAIQQRIAGIDFNSTEVLRNLVEAGFIVFEKPMNDGSFQEVNIATDTSLQEVSDEIELKKAEAKYEADMRKIDAKDKKFDTDLAALEAERNAIKTEMETLKTVAKDNVDRTFKLFS